MQVFQSRFAHCGPVYVVIPDTALSSNLFALRAFSKKWSIFLDPSLIYLANRIQQAVSNYEEYRRPQCELTSTLNNLLLCLLTFEGESGKFQVRIGSYPSVSIGLPAIAGLSKTARRFRFVTSASVAGPVVRTGQREEQVTEMACVFTC
jgi:hypothetical protein